MKIVKIVALFLITSLSTFAEGVRLEKVQSRNAGSIVLESFCSSTMNFYDKGRVRREESREFLKQNKCKGSFLGPSLVMAIKRDFPSISCESGEKLYIAALRRDCLPEELGSKKILILDNLPAFLKKYKSKRTH